ncbi:SH3 domain-containing protein [Exiguobacterium flavidum]|uniref:SH3 domain-containing protein n=1 Tax=Exiguobacterium flavidum TaxID=2184695 RepID=UPI000DF72F4C|nr:SH3 domain-containing protein [Exiguobacterium flavidum]
MNKLTKLCSLAIVFLLLIGTWSIGQGSAAAATGTSFSKASYKTTDNLNLRKSATASSARLLTIPKGKILSSSYRIGNWYKVSYSGKTGYVSGSYLTKVSTVTKASAGVSFASKTYVTTQNLNVRVSGSATAKLLVTIPKGKTITSGYRVGNWYKTTYAGKTGYVAGSYIKEITTVKTATGTSFTSTKYVTTDNLNLRSTASSSGKLYLTIPKGKTITSGYRIGNWYKTTYGGKTGYVAGSYLKKAPTVTGTSFTSTKYVTTDNLNVRSSASTSGKLLVTIPKGKTVTSSYRIGSWYKVTYSGKTGYVAGGYLKKATTVSVPPVTNVVTGSGADYTGGTMYVLVPIGDSLALRATASTSGSLITRLARGEKVRVLNNYTHKTKDFVQVETSGGDRGYVSATYLSLWQPSASYRPLIVIDPGHGGHDVGATRNGIHERDIVLSVAKKVADRLKGKVDLTFTRYTNDYYPSLTDRSVMSNAHATNLFVSIHVNAAEATAAIGAENFYYSGTKDIALAKEIQKRFVSYAGMVDRGVKQGNLSVLRNTNAPAVLAELGFLSNASDRAKLVSPYYQDRYADAIAEGILASL